MSYKFKLYCTSSERLNEITPEKNAIYYIDNYTFCIYNFNKDRYEVVFNKDDTIYKLYQFGWDCMDILDELNMKDQNDYSEIKNTIIKLINQIKSLEYFKEDK